MMPRKLTREKIEELVDKTISSDIFEMSDALQWLSTDFFPWAGRDILNSCLIKEGFSLLPEDASLRSVESLVLIDQLIQSFSPERRLAVFRSSAIEYWDGQDAEFQQVLVDGDF